MLVLWSWNCACDLSLVFIKHDIWECAKSGGCCFFWYRQCLSLDCNLSMHGWGYMSLYLPADTQNHNLETYKETRALSIQIDDKILAHRQKSTNGECMQALIDRPDETRRVINFKRLALTDIKIDIPRLAKKTVLKNAYTDGSESSSTRLPLLSFYCVTMGSSLSSSSSLHSVAEACFVIKLSYLIGRSTCLS